MDNSASNLDKEKVNEGIKNVLSGMLDAFNAETANSEMYKQLIENPSVLAKPSMFASSVGLSTINSAIGLAVSTVYGQMSGMESFVYTEVLQHYDMFERHVRRLVTDTEGSACCADKSRFVMSAIAKRLIDKDAEVTWDTTMYWVPGFGSLESWTALIEGIAHLANGNPEKYLIALKVISSEAIMARKAAIAAAAEE